MINTVAEKELTEEQVRFQIFWSGLIKLYNLLTRNIITTEPPTTNKLSVPCKLDGVDFCFCVEDNLVCVDIRFNLPTDKGRKIANLLLERVEELEFGFEDELNNITDPQSGQVIVRYVERDTEFSDSEYYDELFQTLVSTMQELEVVFTPVIKKALKK